MKKYIYSLIIALGLGMSACADLDLSSPSDASSESWFSSPEEFEFACNDLYRPDLWYWECNRYCHTDRWTDDWSQQDHAYEWCCGTLNSSTGYVGTMWLNTYKGITRANLIISKAAECRGKMNDALLNRYEGEAHLFRAVFYSYLTFLYGDIPYYDKYMTVEEASVMGRTKREDILTHVYEDFDKAIELLPEKSSGNRVKKSTAHAFRARTAAWFLDYPKMAQSAKACMESGDYKLDSDYERMFYPNTFTSTEFIFMTPRSKELKPGDSGQYFSMGSFLPKNTGNKGFAVPSIELMSCYLCTDGLPIDKSPLFDRANPLANRDPRLGYTMPIFGTEFLGYEWNPGSENVMNYSTGKLVKNKDCLINDATCGWTGMIIKKGIDLTGLADKKYDLNQVIFRYADILLMYAEAKMEMGEVDQSVLDAMNDVRARAYKTTRTSSAYPKITTTDINELRFILRTERHMEFAWENRRWFDMMRWRLCDDALNRPIVALPAAADMKKNLKKNNWYFPDDAMPVVKENGCIDLTPLLESTAKFRVSVERVFDPAKGYLLPLPLTDVNLFFNGENNPGY